MLQRIRINDKQYEIKRVYKRHPDSNEQKLVEIKNNLQYDALIKNDQFYFLCNEITDAEFIDVVNEPVNNDELKLQKAEIKNPN